MKTYSGRCRGGPTDGEDLVSMRRRVDLITRRRTMNFTVDTPPDKPVEIEYGHYQHVLGQWVWHADS
jgi:hypothetical protein